MNKIGIIGAMDLEVATLKKNMMLKRTTMKAGMEFLEGTISEVEVVVVKCGIGKVNAGMCVQILADCFAVTHVINTGVAGSLRAEINIGDIVISTNAVYHDMDVTVFGYQLGEVPQIGRQDFPADERMQTLAKSSCEKVNPDIQVFAGRVVSGDQFISSKEVKEHLIQTFDGLCTEMEGAAIAHAAYLNEIPFVIIRAISDKADDSAQEDYPTFEKKAAEHCASLIMDMLTTI
ncbi:MAG: 5'-methylthioadenosine/adenosylhomocysteine nucleosidase [Lachnospiraceae bacterium]